MIVSFHPAKIKFSFDLKILHIFQCIGFIDADELFSGDDDAKSRLPFNLLLRTPSSNA